MEDSGKTKQNKKDDKAHVNGVGWDTRIKMNTVCDDSMYCTVDLYSGRLNESRRPSDETGQLNETINTPRPSSVTPFAIGQ